jgi:DNA-binding MarR family transcriptional regulator
MNKTKLLDAYFRFLNLANAVQKLPGFPQLEAGEARLLEMLAVASHDGIPMTIGEAMMLEEVGAPATLHRKLRRLQDTGLVDMVEHDSDRRVKLVLPTEEAMKHFARIASCMDKARAK